MNIAGDLLNPQELLNAVYSGPFVTAARAKFSNCQMLCKTHNRAKGNR